MRPNKGQIPQIFLRMAILVCLTALYLTAVGFASAKFVSKASAADGATVAQFSPSFHVDNIDVSGIQKPGDQTGNLPFTVQNYTDDKTSEVTIKYKIVVKTTGNLPLHFTLKDRNGTIVDDWTCDGTSGERSYEYQAPSDFAPGVKDQHNYTLTAEWPAGKTDARFAGMTDAVYLSVTWEQVD